jgi:hypothetical protein
MDKPIIFVDVDGVLNSKNGTSEYLFTLPEGTFKVKLTPEHGEMLKDLAESTDAELVWGTMWEESAPIHIAPVLGLPEMPVMKIQRYKMSSLIGHDKAFSAKNYAKGRRFVFFDDADDLGRYLKGTDGLHIYVNPDKGLQWDHIVTAANYLDQYDLD